QCRSGTSIAPARVLQRREFHHNPTSQQRPATFLQDARRYVDCPGSISARLQPDDPSTKRAAVFAVVRELRRRRVRSALTASGIAIGVAALVLLGSLAEKMDRLVAGGRDFATGQITVTGAGTGGTTTGMMRGSLLTADQLRTLPEIEGVAAVAPMVIFPAGDGPPPLPFTLAPLVFGADLETLWRNQAVPAPRVAVGHAIPKPDGSEVVLGSQVARTYGATLDGTLSIRGRDFRVGGILEPTFTGPDSFVFMPFPIAQTLLVESEPVLRRLAL